jgi:hypothetical protein
MATSDPPESSWTVVLRRQPARLVEGQPEGGYTDVYEIVCCDCGDDPDLDYREVSPRLQLVRGPYPIAAGVAAYEQHLKRHEQMGAPLAPRLPSPRSWAPTWPPAAWSAPADGGHPSSSPSSRDWVTAWLREEAPSLR